jgi:hypothetical protein
MKPGVMATIKKYTIGLPFLLLSKLSKPKDVVLPGDWSAEGSNEPRPYTVTKDEEKMLKYLATAVNLAVDKKEGYLTLTVNGMEPVQTADLAIKAQELLQAEVTRFRTEKAEDELKYIQERYNEVKKEAESYQASLAVLTDRSQSMTTSRARLERERLQTKYAVSSAVYSELAKQLENALGSSNFGDQVTGLTYEYYKHGTEEEPEYEIVSITLDDGTPVDINGTEPIYRVVTSNYSATLEGSVFEGKTPVFPETEAPIDNQALIEVLRDMRDAEGSDGYIPVDTGANGVCLNADEWAEAA